jgi:hypothetical protein
LRPLYGRGRRSAPSLPRGARAARPRVVCGFQRKLFLLVLDLPISMAKTRTTTRMIWLRPQPCCALEVFSEGTENGTRGACATPFHFGLRLGNTRASRPRSKEKPRSTEGAGQTKTKRTNVSHAGADTRQRVPTGLDGRAALLRRRTNAKGTDARQRVPTELHIPKFGRAALPRRRMDAKGTDAQQRVPTKEFHAHGLGMANPPGLPPIPPATDSLERIAIFRGNSPHPAAGDENRLVEMCQ